MIEHASATIQATQSLENGPQGIHVGTPGFTPRLYSEAWLNSPNSTGVTGYIGGDILHALNQAHPDWEYSALIRSQDKAKQVQTKYPKINAIIGGLDDSDIIKDAASKADIVIREFYLGPFDCAAR